MRQVINKIIIIQIECPDYFLTNNFLGAKLNLALNFMKIKLFLISLVSLISIAAIFPKTSLAESTNLSTPESSQSSYVLFYPVVAGKVEGDSLYFIKLMRDRITEILTFGNEKKAGVELKIATKRLLEAEKLFKSGKTDLAKKTLSKFTTKLAAAYDHTMKEKSNDFFPELVDEMEQNIQKYQIVLNQLLNSAPDNGKKPVEEAIQQVNDIQNRIHQEIKGS